MPMKNYIPKQHGAWAMLIIPFLFGMFASQPQWLHLLLGFVWLLTYLFTYPLLQWIRTGRTATYAKPLLLYGILLLPSAAALIAWKPDLLRMGLVLLPFFLINCYFAKRNRERDVWNDIAAVVQFSLIVFIAYDVGGGTDWRLAAELFAISALYFTGTVFYVKTMIREKKNRRYYYVSIAYHSFVLLASAVAFPWPLLIPLAVLLIRSAVLPGRKITIKQVGISEIALSIMVAAFVLAPFGTTN